MSTKTTIKRIALVAAVAAAFGGLSTVAANATAPTLSGTSAGSGNTTATLTVGTYNAETITAGTSDNLYTITTSGVGSVYYPSSAPSTLAAPNALRSNSFQLVF